MARGKPSQIESDAQEFGIGVRCGGWRLGLLVARSVEPGKAGRPSNNRSLENDSSKTSMNRFAELAGVSVSHVKYYYDAWQLAAQASLVPSAETIQPGDEDVDVEADSIEVEDNPKTHWSHFYQLAKNPPEKISKKKKQPKEEAVEEDSVDDLEEATSPPKLTSVPEPTEEEVAEFQRNSYIEVLESLSALKERLVREGDASESNYEILSQIASAAKELGEAVAILVKEKAA